MDVPVPFPAWLAVTHKETPWRYLWGFSSPLAARGTLGTSDRFQNFGMDGIRVQAAELPSLSHLWLFAHLVL